MREIAKRKKVLLRARVSRTSQRRQVYETKRDNAHNHNVSTDDDDDVYLNAVHNKQRDTLIASLKVNEWKVRFQIDTDAQVNTIGQGYACRDQVHPTTKNLIMWNKTNMKLVGETVLNVNNPKSNTVHATNFIAVKNNFNCLLGLSTIQELNFITVRQLFYSQS